MQNKIIQGDCLDVMRTFLDNYVDTIISDPPYGLSFMGKKWDYDVPSIEIWQECLRVLKPGGTALIFAGSRTQHRMAVNVEDAGFILKDCIMWLYGSGFPKATDISKQLDKGHERKVVGKHKTKDFDHHKGSMMSKETTNDNETHTKEVNITEPATEEAKLWNGWKSHGLKPAYEPILVAMKQNEGTYANNALKHGVSGLNIDGSRIGNEEMINRPAGNKSGGNSLNMSKKGMPQNAEETISTGRFPANVIFECICDEVIEGEDNGIVDNKKNSKSCNDTIYKLGINKGEQNAPRGYKDTGNIHTNPDCPCYMIDEQSGESKSGKNKKEKGTGGIFNKGTNLPCGQEHGDKGGASRFFYCAKASKSERNSGCDNLEEKSKVFNGQSDEPSKEMKGVEKKFTTLPAKNNHPTVKPLKLMEYLCTLTKTPTGGIVLDPFAGSGTTGLACINTGRNFILIEREAKYIPIIEARIGAKVSKSDLKPLETIAEPIKTEKTLNICDCGGKIVKYSGGMCCQDCMKDY